MTGSIHFTACPYTFQFIPVTLDFIINWSSAPPHARQWKELTMDSSIWPFQSFFPSDLRLSKESSSLLSSYLDIKPLRWLSKSSNKEPLCLLQAINTSPSPNAHCQLQNIVRILSSKHRTPSSGISEPGKSLVEIQATFKLRAKLTDFNRAEFHPILTELTQSDHLKPPKVHPLRSVKNLGDKHFTDGFQQSFSFKFPYLKTTTNTWP